MDRTGDGGYKLRTRMLLFRDEKAIALCPSCKSEVDVPVALGDTSSIPELPKTPLIVRK